MVHKDKISAAIKRNLDEVGMHILERKALIGMEEAKSYHVWDFFRITSAALFNDAIAHIIKVLDKNDRSATFWYIYKQYKKEVDLYLTKIGGNIQQIEDLANKLKIVRDKTHFHIDGKGVKNPKAIWKQADIKGMPDIVDIVWKVLNHIHKLHFGNEFPCPNYTGKDVTKIIKVAKEAGIF